MYMMNLMNLFCVELDDEKNIAPVGAGMPFYAIFFLFLGRFLGSFWYIRFIGADFGHFLQKTGMSDEPYVVECINVCIRFSPKTCHFTAFFDVVGCTCEVHRCTSGR